jgi:hypothetical protein
VKEYIWLSFLIFDQYIFFIFFYKEILLKKNKNNDYYSVSEIVKNAVLRFARKIKFDTSKKLDNNKFKKNENGDSK